MINRIIAVVMVVLMVAFFTPSLSEFAGLDDGTASAHGKGKGKGKGKGHGYDNGPGKGPGKGKGRGHRGCKDGNDLDTRDPVSVDKDTGERVGAWEEVYCATDWERATYEYCGDLPYFTFLQNHPEQNMFGIDHAEFTLKFNGSYYVINPANYPFAKKFRDAR